MSGPKCDEIVLSEERRRKFEETLRLEKERIEKEREERRRRMEEWKRKEKERREQEEKRKKTIRELDDFDMYMDAVLDKIQETQQEGISSGDEDLDREGFEAAMEQLQQEEAAAEAVFVENCQREVCMVVEETIQEMGYQLIGSKASDESTSTLYRYDDKTAINVTDAKGQFTMEIVRMDVVGRAATAQEADELARCMENFCTDYRKIQKKLRDNGLEVRNELFHLPPDSKYACIVNASEYAMVKDKKGSRRAAEDYETRQGENALQLSRKMRESL